MGNIVTLIGEAAARFNEDSFDHANTVYLGADQAQMLYDYFAEQYWFSGEENTARRLKRMIAHGKECPWPKTCVHGVPDRWPVDVESKTFIQDRKLAHAETFTICGLDVVITRAPSMLLVASEILNPEPA